MKAATRFAPCAGDSVQFQSTPPVKAATLSEIEQREREEFQSTPPVKAATLRILDFCIDFGISIHAAREGGDTNPAIYRSVIRISIHAAREGGDVETPETPEEIVISIHAAREGGDLLLFVFKAFKIHFNPRRP